MRIVKQGYIPAKCPNCSTEVVIEGTSDLKIGRFGGDWTEAGERKWYYECPGCGKDIVPTGVYWPLPKE